MTEIKVIILGDRGVGKSSICQVFIKDSFSVAYNPNEEEFYNQKIRINKKEVFLNIIDINSTSPMFKKLVSESDCFLFVYDITNSNSFIELLSLQKLVSSLRQSFSSVLVGNKSDLIDSREVSYDQGLTISLSWGCKFLEVSAKYKKGVYQAFTLCAVVSCLTPSDSQKCCCEIM